MNRTRISFLLIVIFLILGVHPKFGHAKLTIDKVIFEGVEVFSNKRLNSMLRIKRIEEYNEHNFRSDLEVIFDLYRQHGYLHIKKVESEDDLTDDGKRHLIVTLNEGEQTRFRDIRIRLLDQDFSTAALDSLTISETLGFQSGDPFNRILINQQRQLLANTYANLGFAYAIVSDSAYFSADQSTADAVILITEGNRVTIKSIKITGNEKVRQKIIDREVRSKPGDVFSLIRIQEDQQRLYSTSLFRDARFVINGFEESLSQVDIDIQVVEEKLKWIGGGVGYGTQDGGRISGEYGHNNIFNNAQKFKIISKLTKTDIINKSDTYRLTRRLETEYVDPRLFGISWTSGLNLAYQYEDDLEKTKEDISYQLETYTIRLATGRPISRYNQLSFQVTARMDSYFDVVDKSDVNNPSDPYEDPIQEGRTVTNSFSASISRDTRNDVFNPTRGYFLFLSAKIGGSILYGDNNFLKLNFDSSSHRRYKWVVFSIRAQGGKAISYGSSYLIEKNDQFTYGGSTTNRGYGELSLGSMNHRGSLSGNALLATTGEIRVSFLTYFQVVFFADYGKLWFTDGEIDRSDQSNFSLRNDPETSDGKLSLGMGFRYLTPVGPLRIDLGLPMEEETWEERWNHKGFFISFGQAF
ncbi:MAG: hypothetical protein B6244_05200 [Candidatus Cloacimonetes bacterium 4572_55]|nr:MAG: hypothetical protein B6244_05200 [Candidatus Cloacimonetes bacterium 4572_55]